MIAKMLLASALSINPALNAYIQQLAPKENKARLERIGNFIDKEASWYDIDPFTVAAIIAQESRFKKHSISCTIRSCDWGITQINDAVISERHIDKIRLINDDLYAIHIAFTMLYFLHTKYSNEINYWSRYHDSRPKQRLTYEVMVNELMKNKDSFVMN